MRQRRGVVLGFVVIMAVVLSIMAYTALVMAVSQRRRPAGHDEATLKAQLASESGVEWTRERLYEDAGGILEQIASAPARQATLKPPAEITNGLTVTVIVTAQGNDAYTIESTAVF